MGRSRLILTADQQLSRRAMAWATRIGVSPTRVVVADLPRNWGSCTPDGVVTFAMDLADQSVDFQHYVIVHELLHLRYRSHGKRFTAMMTALVPTWRELERTHPGRRAR